MRLRPAFVSLIALATSALTKLHGAAPVYTATLESSAVQSALDTRDVPNNVDYRCGPKIGKCPVGTCCSGAGMCQKYVGDQTTDGKQASVGLPRHTAAPRTARLTTAIVTLIDPLMAPLPKRFLGHILVKSHSAQPRSARVPSPELSR